MIGAIVRCYNLTFMLKGVLESLADIDIVLVAVCNFSGDNREEKVTEILHNLKQDNVICSFYPNMPQNELFNRCKDKLNSMGVDIILINDADEILLKNDRDRVIRRLVESQCDAIHATVIDYANLDATERFEERTHKPVVAIKPCAFFDGNRSVVGGDLMEDVMLHHFGYALDEDEMAWKLNNLWYRKQSAKAVICSRKDSIKPQTELIGRLK